MYESLMKVVEITPAIMITIGLGLWVVLIGIMFYDEIKYYRNKSK
jgi:hypothetical protein